MQIIKKFLLQSLSKNFNMSKDSDDSPIDVNEFVGDGTYATPAQKSVKEIIEADGGDESLKKFVVFCAKTEIFDSFCAKKWKFWPFLAKNKTNWSFLGQN